MAPVFLCQQLVEPSEIAIKRIKISNHCKDITDQENYKIKYGRFVQFGNGFKAFHTIMS